MSSLTRDPRGFFGDPRMARRADSGAGVGKWHWPDPETVAPPVVQETDVARDWRSSAETLEGLWPAEPPMDSWPGSSEDPAVFADLIAPEQAAFETPAAGQRSMAPAYQPVAPLDRVSHSPQQDHRDVDPYAAQPMGFAPQAPQQSQAASNASLAGAGWSGVDWSHATSIPAEPVPLNDPSPSRFAYRLNRMWLTPRIRGFVQYGLPVLLTVGFAALWLSDAGRRADLAASFASVRAYAENQPIFQIGDLDVQSRSPEVAQGVAQLVDVTFPISTFQLDYDGIREQVEELDVVQSASVRASGGTLHVRITERLPAMIWRNAAGLDLIDETGHRVARLAWRDARADLPLIAGTGAPEAMDEARALFAALRPLEGRVRGLVRVGTRRWNVVLDRGQRILLPEAAPLEALERVLALHTAQQLLDRDIQTIDMRNLARPILQLNPTSGGDHVPLSQRP